MKIELKHLARYLPYGLKMLANNDFVSPKIRKLTVDGFEFTINQRKPILHPLSDLTKEIEVDGEKFVPIDRLFGSAYRIQGFKHYVNIFNGGFELTITKGNKTVYADFYMYQKLYEWHFDIHGLIEQGLAISIHDV